MINDLFGFFRIVIHEEKNYLLTYIFYHQLETDTRFRRKTRGKREMKITMREPTRGRCEEKRNKGKEKIPRATRAALKRSSLIGIIFFVLYVTRSSRIIRACQRPNNWSEARPASDTGKGPFPIHCAH